MGFSLHQHGHTHGGHSHGGHSHGNHSHGNQEQNASTIESNHSDTSSDVIIKDGPNINVRAAFIHVIGDFIQSIGVFIAALIIYFKVSI